MKQKKQSLYDVAKYIIKQEYELLIPDVRMEKLQLLIYYSQAWSLVWDRRPLFCNKIYAHINGPAIPDLFMAGSAPFYKEVILINGKLRNLSNKKKKTIRAVLKAYGNLTPQQLIDLSKSEYPWLAARQYSRQYLCQIVEIRHDVLRAFYLFMVVLIQGGHYE